MSHLRLTTSTEPDSGAVGPGAARFASFTPMNDQPGLADRKASFVIAACGLLLTTTTFLVMPLGQFLRPGVWPATVLALASALTVVVLLAIRAAYRCHVLAAPVRPDNPLFFQNIAAAAPSEYADVLVAATPREALRDVLDYNQAMARLGVAKYRLVGRAMLCLRLAIPLWVVLLVMIGLRGA